MATVAAALLHAPEQWMPALASSADEDGQRLLAEVGFAVERRRIGKQVEIKLGQPVQTAGRTRLPITWRATGPHRLFPVLDGELEVAPLGPNLTQLGLSASYKPPLGSLGASLDRALLHRVAEATVRDFVNRVAAVLEEQAS